VKYDLQQLGPTGFQDVAAALAVATFGAGVQVMGAGRDGGRDMYYKGPLVWAKTDEQVGEVWDGYTVLQAKHKAELASRPGDNSTIGLTRKDAIPSRTTSSSSRTCR
jgi:hypothetical protein